MIGTESSGALIACSPGSSAATPWRTFRYITLPMLRPVMVVCIVIRSIDAFRTFDIVWTISGGGPARATEVFSIYAYVEAFQFLNFGRGSAAADNTAEYLTNQIERHVRTFGLLNCPEPECDSGINMAAADGTDCVGCNE
jgi:hypothetical protein